MAEYDVLVVEDEPDLVATYRRLLRRHGVHVAAAGSRAEALSALRTGAPRLLIVDLGLPDGDGLDVVRAARALPTPADVIVITGTTSPALREAAALAGARDILSKPFSTRALDERLSALLGSARA